MVLRSVLGSGQDEYGRAVSVRPHHYLAGILLLGIALRLYCLTAESLWFDETYSVAFAQRPLGDFSLFRLEGPPFTDRNLYHLALHFWLILGRGDTYVRLLSVILGAGCILAVHVLGAELFGVKVGLWSALLLAISPFHIWYSQEARMYMLAALLTLLSALFSWQVLNLEPGDAESRFWARWVGLIVFTAGALYTHFFSVFVILAQTAFVAFMFLTGRISWSAVKRWMLALFGVFLLAIPLLRGLIVQQQMDWWAWIDARYGRPTPFDLMDTAVTFSYGTTLGDARIQRWIGMLAFLVVIVAGVFAGRSRRKGSREILFLDLSVWFCVFWLLLPLASIYVLSQPLLPGNRNMYVLRYFLPFLAPYLMLAARGIAHLPGTVPRVSLIVILFLVTGPALYRTYSEQQKEDWRGVATYVAEKFEAGDLILLMDEDIRVPFDHYWPAESGATDMTERDAAEIWPVWRGVTKIETLEGLAKEATRAHSRIWLVLSHTPHRSLEMALNRHPELERTDSTRFVGIDLALYEKVGA